MKFFNIGLFLPVLLLINPASNLWANEKTSPVSIWKELLEKKSDSVTWVSVTVRIEVSSGGRSFPPSERKLEALGTVIGKDGLIVLSLNQVDPTDSILARMRSPGSVNVNYTEVLILLEDGSEVSANFLLKDEDLDLAFIRPLTTESNDSDPREFLAIEYNALETPNVETLDEVVSLGKLGRNLYRKSTLQRGWINAVIDKPRDYLVVENVTPGTPVFDRHGKWIGVTVFRKEGGRPSGVITVPASDVMEIARQVRERTE
jgi:S1-C subfamily serine protease